MDSAADLLVQARIEAGLSQAALARMAGIPRSVLNAYERGKRQPGADMLGAILGSAGYELRISPRIDHVRNARILAEVLDLAERLPFRSSRKLTYPAFKHRAR